MNISRPSPANLARPSILKPMRQKLKPKFVPAKMKLPGKRPAANLQRGRSQPPPVPQAAPRPVAAPARPVAASAPRPASATSAVAPNLSAANIRQLLLTRPSAVRTALVLSEILQPPLALREI